MNWLPVAVGLWAAVSAWGTPVDGLSDWGTFTPEERQILADQGHLVGSAAGLDQLSLWQKIPAAAGLKARLGGRPSTMASEAVFLFDRPMGTDLESRLVSAVTAVSTMKGLEVYSDSQKKMETFLFESYRVDASGSKAPLPDPETAAWGPLTSFTVYQKEEQAGDVYSQMTVEKADGLVTVTLTNLTPISLFGFRFVDPGKLNTVFLFIPLAEKVAVVAVTTVDSIRFFGLETVKQKSFAYRLIALGGWFEANLRRDSRSSWTR